MTNIKDKTELVRGFRDGVFSLHTRRFGTVAELIVCEKYNMSNDTDSQHHDAVDKDGKRVEIKFSRVLKANGGSITKSNILSKTVDSSTYERAVKYEDVNSFDFDCNIQQVKRTEFDVLYYGLFFADKLAVFSLDSSEVLQVPGYSDFQHKGNEGEGQFHLNGKSIDYHLKNNLKDILSYEEIYDMFKISKTK